MKSRKKVVVGVLVVLALAVLWAGYVVWFNKDADKRTAEVVAIANQFKAPADWEVTANSINRPTITGCIDIVCPSVHRNWSFEAISPREISSIIANLKSTGWKLSPEEGCDEADLASNKSTVCTLSGSAGEHRVDFTVWAQENKLVRATLIVD